VRRLRPIALTAVVAAGLAAASAPYAGSAGGKAALKVAGAGPVTVRGMQFQPFERVRITLRGGTLLRRTTARTNGRGAFRITVAVPGWDPCLESLQVTAAGARGDRAAEKLPQRACLPAP
jgi:hypothetical protein